MDEQKNLALYHYLCAAFFIVPVVGVVAVAVHRLRRRNPTEVEEEHYHAVLNFQLVTIPFMIVPFLFLPIWLAFAVLAIGCAYAAWICIKNGKLVTKGEPYSYPLAIKLVQPRKKAMGVEEMMYLEKNREKDSNKK